MILLRRFRSTVPPLLLALVLIVWLTGCGGNGKNAGNPQSPDNPNSLQVVTSLPVFADFVHQVGGDRVEVTSLVPMGADPHTWEPSPSDVQRVAEADLAFANGPDLDASAIQVLQANLRSEAPLVQFAGDHEAEEELEDAGAEVFSGAGPHIWMGILNGIAYAAIVRNNLTTVDPAGEATYAENHRAYVEKINETERYAFQRLDTIPPENKKLIATHNAFEYYGGYYGIELTAFLSSSPGQEPTPEDIATIRQTIEDRDVLAVFTEPQISAESEILRQAAEDAGVEVCTLYSDSLDDKVPTYIDLIRFDADELARCLGGEAP